MPYVDKQPREHLDPAIDALASLLDSLDVGDLNYAVTRLCDCFALRNGEYRYSDSLNDVIGVLECAKLEYYVRSIPYEQLKRLLNGDAYPKTQAAIRAAYERAKVKPGVATHGHTEPLSR